MPETNTKATEIETPARVAGILASIEMTGTTDADMGARYAVRYRGHRDRYAGRNG